MSISEQRILWEYEIIVTCIVHCTVVCCAQNQISLYDCLLVLHFIYRKMGGKIMDQRQGKYTVPSVHL